MSFRRTALLSLLPLGLLVPMAHADFAPVVPKSTVFLTCTTATKEHTTAESTGTSVPTWGSAAPASVTTGAGCGKADDGLFSGAAFQTPYQFGFGGTYTGNLNALTVTLHSASIGTGRPSLEPVTLAVRMTVDGVSMFGDDTRPGATGQIFSVPAERDITVTPVATGATGGVTAYTFSVKGLDLLTEADNVEHDVQFDIASGALTSEAWLWGAAEAPTGAVLNPDTLAAAQATANKRSTRNEGLDSE